MNHKRQKLVVVLGMHRSGTSAVTCGLQIMGIDLGSNLMPPKPGENDIGFFEDLDLNQLNIAMLSALDSDWHSVAPLEKDFPEILRKKGYFQEAVGLLRQKMRDFPNFAFKDPRTARLLPFWKQVFEYCSLDVSYIVAIRNPISVAKSLARRNSFDLEKSFVLWVGHNLDVLQSIIHEKESILVDYDRFIDAPIEELNRIARYLDSPIDQSKLKTYLSEFHQKRLRHTIQEADDVLLNDFTSRTASELYDLLRGATRIEGSWKSAGIQEQISRVAAAFEPLALLLSWIDRLYANYGEIQRHATSLQSDIDGRDHEIANLSARNIELHNSFSSINEVISGLTHELADRNRQNQEAIKVSAERVEAIAELERIVGERDSEIRQLNERLIEADNRLSEFRNLVMDRDAKLRSLTDNMVQDTAAFHGVGRSTDWHHLVELDGFAFVRAAYKTLLNREPDPSGRQYYLSRLRMGAPKLTILGELQSSPEGQRVQAAIHGLRGAVKRQKLADIPIFGNVLAPIFGVEKIGRLHTRMRAVQQQVLGISTIIRTHMNAATTDVNQGFKEGDNGSTNGGKSDAQNRAPIGAKPIVFQLDYKTATSPASVGQNTDTRELALGIRRLEMTDKSSGAQICQIDFTSEGNSRDFTFFGFGDPEPWGTWSIGKTSAIIVWHEHLTLGELDVVIDATPFSGASPVTECVLTSSIGHRRELILTDGKLEYVVEPGSTASRDEAMLFHEPTELELVNNVSLAGATPVVSIVILNFNKPQISILSARAVLASSIRVPFEVIIVDNGSSADSYEILQLHDIPVRLLRIPVNRYFGEGNNLGAEAARGEFLVFLNNDAFPTAGCIDALLDAFRTNPLCGAAGPVFKYPDGRLQEAGALVAADGRAVQRGKFDRDFDVLSLPEHDVVDYVSAACLMIRASLFSTLGGFNYRYDPAYYEDTDLCLRVRLRGKNTFLVRTATCVHIENATTGDKRSKKDNGGSTVDHNRDVFLSSWGTFLSNRSDATLPFNLVPTGDVQTETRVREITQAAYSPYPLVPGGGERYILAATLALNELGAAAFVTPDPYSRLRLDSVMFDLGLPIGRIDTLSVEKIKSRKLERAIIMGNELFPHYLLPAERSIFHCQFPFPENELAKSDMRDRLGYLAMCEKVIVNSEFTERSYREGLEKYGRTAIVEVVNPPVATERLLRIQRNNKPFILSIGRFSQAGHDKRQDILIDAMKTTAKAFRREWTLILCGTVPNNPRDRAYFQKLRKSVGNDINVKFVLSPSTGTVDELRSQCSIYAHACGYGVRGPEEYWKCEHFGITLVEALVAGCSIICYEKGGGEEIIKKVGSGKTFGSVEELASRLEEAAGLNVNDEVRSRTSHLYGDKSFMKRLISVAS
jgi:O-antigen biosynthesis protein